MEYYVPEAAVNDDGDAVEAFDFANDIGHAAAVIDLVMTSRAEVFQGIHSAIFGFVEFSHIPIPIF